MSLKNYLTESNKDLKTFNKLVDNLYTFVSEKIDGADDSNKKVAKLTDDLSETLVDLEDFEKKVYSILKKL